MLGLHGRKVVTCADREIVPAGRKFQDRDIGCRSVRNGLFQEAFRIAEEPLQSLCHIRLIGRDRGNFRALNEESRSRESGFLDS
jgi:hypothetical protein